eukprot:15400335-Alexandrium_andersonii.AAC.1
MSGTSARRAGRRATRCTGRRSSGPARTAHARSSSGRTRTDGLSHPSLRSTNGASQHFAVQA